MRILSHRRGENTQNLIYILWIVTKFVKIDLKDTVNVFLHLTNLTKIDIIIISPLGSFCHMSRKTSGDNVHNS